MDGQEETTREKGRMDAYDRFPSTPDLHDGVGSKEQQAQGPAPKVEEVETSTTRRVWVALVWALTFWIPSFLLHHIGRMKRPDVRMVALCMLISLFCSTIIFYIVFFGKIICPGMDKAWNDKELGFHQGASDYWVAVRGEVYDLTKWYRVQHSDVVGLTVNGDEMLEIAGEDLTSYFPIPLNIACPSLVSDATIALQYENFTATLPTAIHVSGIQQTVQTSRLHEPDWYFSIFLPKMKDFRKGPKVISKKRLREKAEVDRRSWAYMKRGGTEKVFDLTDFFYTQERMAFYEAYQFLDEDLAALFQAESGGDVTASVNELLANNSTLSEHLDCIETLFYVGETDFRETARCLIQPYLLLTFSIIIVATIGVKFLASLQLGTKRQPELKEKFVICQVPCYTEGEEQLQKTIDSLATLAYDDRRKLLLIICDGWITGHGNDKPTPEIVLELLGVSDEAVKAAQPLMYRAVGEGSKQLNYARVYSGLYDCEGHVVPFLVVAKTGRPTERSRPGNRGKRDSQIMIMRFLRNVHFAAEMCPLELEMCHQITNVIGVAPNLYEFLLTVDADTRVTEDSLNRLVSCASDDSKIIGICGETKLSNEQESWWTMIQVYDYYVSHLFTKAFESLFGSVTCLPGCFTMFRIRSADKGKPLLVADAIIEEYSTVAVDTLHLKNLLQLGEDRYLTTLVLKHFPKYKTKFTPDATAYTAAPESWGVLISQRRRWTNSTIHNLAELIFLPDMCGFLCFSMRFVVIIDLLGTIILPAAFVYLIYLIVNVSTGSGQIPLISLIMIAAVYGFQAVVFLLRRQWQFLGWMVIYILATPIYAFLLPIYSFWCMDDFGWGSTRVVVGEGKSKRVLTTEDEHFDDASIPRRTFAEYELAIKESASQTNLSEQAGFTASRVPSMYSLPPALYGAPSRPISQAFSAAYPGFRPGSIHMAESEYGFPPPALAHARMPSFAPTDYMAPSPISPFAMGHPAWRNSSMTVATSNVPYGRSSSDSPVYTPLQNPFSSHPPSPSSSVPAELPLEPSDDADPSDSKVIETLRAYLARQDLMQVTKRTTREALKALFPKADLESRKSSINSFIDSILAGSL